MFFFCKVIRYFLQGFFFFFARGSTFLRLVFFWQVFSQKCFFFCYRWLFFSMDFALVCLRVFFFFLKKLFLPVFFRIGFCVFVQVILCFCAKGFCFFFCKRFGVFVSRSLCFQKKCFFCLSSAGGLCVFVSQGILCFFFCKRCCVSLGGRFFQSFFFWYGVFSFQRCFFFQRVVSFFKGIFLKVFCQEKIQKEWGFHKKRLPY